MADTPDRDQRQIERLARETADLSRQLQLILRGKKPEVVSGALADCASILIAGHCVLGDQAATTVLRGRIAEVFFDLVLELIEPSAKQIAETMARRGEQTPWGWKR